MSVSILGYHQILPSNFRVQLVSQIENLSFISGELELDRASAFFPGRSDEKIMRTDVVASIISINTLFENFKITEPFDNYALYAATGVFIEKIENHTRHLIRAYEELNEESTPAEITKKLYRGSPPLLALQTLTNSVMSFISQYTGIKGNNATFGTTSVSGFYALQEAYNTSWFDGTNSVVCAANVAGAHSYLMNSPMYGDKSDWRESAAVGCLLIGKSKSETPACCKITHVKNNAVKNHLQNELIQRNWAEMIPDISADMVLFSGAFNTAEQKLDKNYCEKHWTLSDSLFDEFGNMGAANVINSVIRGIQLLEKGYNKIDIVDRDIYGSESFVRIEKNK